METAKSVLQVFAFALAIAAAATVVGLALDKLVDAMTTQPVGIVVWVGMCLLTGLLLCGPAWGNIATLR